MTTLYDYIGDKEKEVKDEKASEEQYQETLSEKIKRQRRLNVNFPGFDGKLSTLISGIRTIPNYNNLKGYVRENILSKNPDLTYKALSDQTGIHEGVALVILYDLYYDKLEEELKEIDEDKDYDFHYED